MINRRELLKHSAQATGGILACLTSWNAMRQGPAWADDDATLPRLKVCLVSGSGEYKSNESLATLQKLLESRYAVECTRAFWTEGRSDDLPGLEALDSTDVMVLFTKRLKIAGEQLERVKKYCLSGKPIVGIRTASHAFQNWLALDAEVFGGDYHGHYRGGDTVDIKMVGTNSRHPILKNIKNFTSTCKIYKNPKVAEDVDVLLTGTMPDSTQPVAWARNFKSGRVFYTSLGDPHDFRNEEFQKLLINALQWTTRRQFAGNA
jgi:type 1 glutamine amidotransferase